jgi:hypothetical protein
MNTLANHPNNQKLADAALSLKAMRKYQRDRRAYGANRVHQYFDNVDGDWLERFDNDESNEPEECHLSKDLCKL